ncbi:MAG: hypothetical protein GX548_12180, partial [Lentisphaerae bacterium]|nr:hypothetical protein [Lentisphaerota bacterium]
MNPVRISTAHASIHGPVHESFHPEFQRLGDPISRLPPPNKKLASLCEALYMSREFFLAGAFWAGFGRFPVVSSFRFYTNWKNMLSFIATSLFSFAVYLLLTAGSGRVLGLWSGQDLWAGVFLAVIVGWVARPFFCDPKRRAALQPMRWVRGIGYACGPFFLEMAKANVDVAYRVITGRIRPGIVRVRSGMQTDLGVLMLA